MISPSVFSEQILFQTIRLECNGFVGTGFILGFQVEENLHIPIVVTNKHVIDFQPISKVLFSLHVRDSNGTILESTADYDWKSEWMFHPDDSIDLCCTLFKPIIDVAAQNGLNLYYHTCPDDFIPTDEILNDLQTVNDIIMVGYPDGLYDEKHCLPLVRKGMTATHPSIDFNGLPEGVIDIGCMYGSSGSPIYSFPGLYQYNKSNGYTLASYNPILYGIFYGMACTDIEGKVLSNKVVGHMQYAAVKQRNGRVTTEVPINIGYYIKAKELRVFKDLIISRYGISQ